VITSLRRLSQTIRKAAPAPGAELVSAIKADRERIEREIKSTGASYVTVGGQKFKVVGTTDG
jgi:hypothetical protein